MNKRNYMKRQQLVTFAKKKFKLKYTNDENYGKANSHCHYTGKYQGTAHFICNIRYSLQNEIFTAFHHGFNYDYDFIIEEVAIEFKGELYCYEENTEKYKICSVPITKVKRFNTNRKQITKTISYQLQFIVCARFMASPLSNLFVNVAERVHKIKFINGHDNKISQECRIKYKA